MKIAMANLMLVILIVLSLMFADTSTAEFDLETVVGMWLFDEGKGNTAADSSENGNDGKFENDPKWTKDGKFGSGLEFDETRVRDTSLSGIWVYRERLHWFCGQIRGIPPMMIG